MSVRLLVGDCLTVLPTLEPESVDAIVTDPPYGLSFMGKAWDHGVPGVPFWVEALRVAKPGVHLVAFGGTRMWHRLACAIEDAGWEIRDTLCYLYGSGFPKSLDVSKAMDKAAGAQRLSVGSKVGLPGYSLAADKGRGTYSPDGRDSEVECDITAPTTDLARQWDGWGTALKPGHEPIILARKPLVGTVASNVAQYGTGALNIDGTRIGAGVCVPGGGQSRRGHGGVYGDGEAPSPASSHTSGRWPANVVLSHGADCREVGTRVVRGKASGSGNLGPWRTTEGRDDVPTIPDRPDAEASEIVPVWECVPDCPVALLDAQSGETGNHGGAGLYASRSAFGGGTVTRAPSDTGGASRFFYTSKAGKRERNEGGATNTHATVKPVGLMTWLVKLVTPPRGVVLDPFMGSGTTGVAAFANGCDFIGIDLDPAFVEIAKQRIGLAA